MLLKFLEQQYPDLSATEQLAFDKLLATPDDLLIGYVHGDQIPTELELKQIVEKIRK